MAGLNFFGYGTEDLVLVNQTYIGSVQNQLMKNVFFIRRTPPQGLSEARRAGHFIFYFL